MNIDDREQCAVYADELLEKGDPLGELMAAHLRGDSETRRRVTADYLAARFPFLQVSDLDVTWKNGLFERMSVETHLGVETVKAIHSTPAAGFLRELQLSFSNSYRQPSADDHPSEEPTALLAEDSLTHAIPTLAEYPLPRTLRKLDLGISLEPFYRGGALSRRPEPPPLELQTLYPQLRMLEELTLSVHARLGRIDLPSLRVLSIELDGEETANELAHAMLPKLEELHLQRSYWAMLEQLDIPAAPNFERLTLTSSADGLQGNAYLALGESPLLRRARTLTLSYVRFGDCDLLTLIAPKLLHLDQVRVRREHIHEEERSELTRILGSRLVLE